MPQIDTTSLDNLVQAVTDISYRSNRLREWLELEPRLRNLENTISDFFQKVDKINPAAVPSKARMNEIKQSWNHCKITDIEDLKSFALSVQNINKTLPVTTGTPIAPLVDTWIQELLTISDQIQTDLDNLSIMDFKQDCAKFQMVLYARIADRRNLLAWEVKELCESTIRLRIKLGE
jgi:hypothetical protein